MPWIVNVWLTRSTAVLRTTSWFEGGGTGSFFFWAYASSVPSITINNDCSAVRINKRIVPPDTAHKVSKREATPAVSLKLFKYNYLHQISIV
jgi:hypothetical protein